ncbi:hypothetical protein Droror1_Dr00015616 [Drosera rotundifolia]
MVPCLCLCRFMLINFALDSVFHVIVNRNDAIDSMGSVDGSGSVSERALSPVGARCHVMKLKWDGESHGEEKEAAGGSMRTIFMHSDGFDRLLMVLGSVGSIGDGLTLPVTLIVTGKLINNIGESSKFGSGVSFSHSVDNIGNAVMLCYVTFGAWCVCFLEGYCWTRTTERQASKNASKHETGREWLGLHTNQLNPQHPPSIHDWVFKIPNQVQEGAQQDITPQQPELHLDFVIKRTQTITHVLELFPSSPHEAGDKPSTTLQGIRLPAPQSTSL